MYLFFTNEQKHPRGSGSAGMFCMVGKWEQRRAAGRY